MTDSQFSSLDSSNSLKQAITNLLKATEMEVTALSNILNYEKEVIQKAKTNSINLDEFVALNESVNSILPNINKVQTMTQVKLQFVEKLLHKIDPLAEKEDLKE